MRKFIPILVVMALLMGILISPALAQENINVDTGITPDSPFYFVDNFWKSVRLTFTFNKIRKIERRMEFARERLAEAEQMSKENKVEAMERALERYEKQIQHAEEKIEKRTELADKVAEMTAKHLKILERVIDKAPENARAGLERALEASEKGHVRAIQILEITDIKKAREFSARNIRQIKVRVEKQIQEKRKQLKQDSKELQIKTSKRIEKNVDDAKKMMEELREKQGLDIKNRLELLKKFEGEKTQEDDKKVDENKDDYADASFNYMPNNLDYEIKEDGILITWNRPSNYKDVASYKIYSKGWGFTWKEVAEVKEVTEVKEKNYYLELKMDKNLCDLDIKIISVRMNGEPATYFPAFIHNIDHVANKDTWQKDCGPQF